MYHRPTNTIISFLNTRINICIYSSIHLTPLSSTDLCRSAPPTQQTICFSLMFVCLHTFHNASRHPLVPLRTSTLADNLLLSHARLPKCRRSPFSNSIVCQNTDNTAKITISSAALTFRFACKLQTI